MLGENARVVRESCTLASTACFFTTPFVFFFLFFSFDFQRRRRGFFLQADAAGWLLPLKLKLVVVSSMENNQRET